MNLARSFKAGRESTRDSRRLATLELGMNRIRATRRERPIALSGAFQRRSKFIPTLSLEGIRLGSFSLSLPDKLSLTDIKLIHCGRRVTRKRISKSLPFLIITLVTGACGALQPPNAGGPAPSGPPYPVTLTEQAQRREAAILALNRITLKSGPANLTEGYLEPVTATIKSLPADPGTPQYLPKVGSDVEMNEEETREALRRFINDWRVLIGANPSQLSLVQRVDRPDQTKVALYEQRAFRYPLRGDFGKLQIHFMSNRRLLNVISSCIPDADRLQATLASITPQLTAEDAIKHVRDRGVRYTDSSGNQQTFNVSAGNEIISRELVTYALPSKLTSDSLEIHIAWEVTVSNAPFKTAYVDALNNEIIAVL